MGSWEGDAKFQHPSQLACALVVVGRARRASEAGADALPGRLAPWPTLDRVGTLGADVARVLAEEVRVALLGPGRREEPLLDLRPLMRRGRFRLSVEDLGAADGGMEAFLVPDTNDRFEVVVDPEPRGGWRPQLTELREDIHRHRLRFRIGHEVAHSFLFQRTPGEFPRRRGTDSPEEERFCDAFAGALLLPPSVVAQARPTPDDVLGLQAQYDVSLQQAVRMFAEVHLEHAFVLLYTDEEPPFVRPQWASPRPDWEPRWWARESVQTLGSRAAQAIVVPHRSGRRSRLRAKWLPQRRQALLVGR